MAALPTFRYHPDPVATGSIVVSDKTCSCCVEARGYIYVGPVYSEQDVEDELCPWCIADGSAAEEYEATFVDPDGIGNYGEWDEVKEEVIEQVSRRTPGFSGWQQERWWTHCNEAAAFLGLAGNPELRSKWSNAIPAIKEDSGQSGKDWEAYLAALDKTRGPTAYVFQCLECGELGGYSDCH